MDSQQAQRGKMTELSSEVLKELEGKKPTPFWGLSSCPFLLRYRPMELTDIYGEENQETNTEDTAEELE